MKSIEIVSKKYQFKPLSIGNFQYYFDHHDKNPFSQKNARSFNKSPPLKLKRKKSMSTKKMPSPKTIENDFFSKSLPELENINPTNKREKKKIIFVESWRPEPNGSDIGKEPRDLVTENDQVIEVEEVSPSIPNSENLLKTLENQRPFSELCFIEEKTLENENETNLQNTEKEIPTPVNFISAPTVLKPSKSQKPQLKRKKSKLELKLQKKLEDSNEHIDLYLLLQKSCMITEEIEKHFEMMKDMTKQLKVGEHEISSREINIIGKSINLKSNKTLFLDMDDTLMHTYDTQLYNYAECEIDHHSKHVIVYSDYKEFMSDSITIIMRPYLQHMLRSLAPFYQIIVFTAAEQEYADPILNFIDPRSRYFAQRLYRQHCITRQSTQNQIHLKDLRVIRNRDMRSMILVDNSIISFANQLDNGIHVPTFTGDVNDEYLLPLTLFLLKIYSVSDVRDAIRTKFLLSELYQIFSQ